MEEFHVQVGKQLDINLTLNLTLLIFVACTIVLGLGEQLAEIRNSSLINGTREVCDKLPAVAENTCYLFVEKIEPLLLSK